MIFNNSNDIEKKAFLMKAQQLAEDNEVVELKKKRNKRTIKQNAYLHICISLFAIEFGYTINEAKTLLKRNCHFMIYEKNSQKFIKETRGMDTKEMTDFIEWLIDYSGKNGLFIPSSEDYIINQLFFDKQIDSQKQYL